MKKILLFGFILTSFFGFGQFGGRSQQRRQMTQPTQQKAPKPDFPVEKYVGIIIYDIEKAAKKSGVKLSSKEGKTFSSFLYNYNKNTKDVRRINGFVLKSTKQMVDNYQSAVMKTGDFSNQAKVMKKMQENLKPIGEIIKKEDLVFDKKIKELLSKKQYKKWIKYNRKLGKVFPTPE